VEFNFPELLGSTSYRAFFYGIMRFHVEVRFFGGLGGYVYLFHGGSVYSNCRRFSNLHMKGINIEL
jgi:hypothetical protein